MMHTTGLRHLPIITLALLTIVVATLTATVADAQAAISCQASRINRSAPVIALLADGRSPALVAAAATIANEPAAAFAAPVLAGKRARSGSEHPVGIVVLMTYDAQGNVQNRGAYDLAGVGNDDRNREESRRHLAQCLKQAVAALPKATQTGGDLLRSLERASAYAAQSAGGSRAEVVAVGLGRSTIDGQAIAGLDLTAAGQTQIYSELDRVGLVPDLSSSRVALRFLDPSDGVSSSISAAGVESFAASLCGRVSARRCTSGVTAY